MGPSSTLCYLSTVHENLHCFRYDISSERSQNLASYTKERRGMNVTLNKLGLVWVDLSWTWAFWERWEHTSPDCLLYKGLTEKNRTVRNFILHEEAMAGICWVPTLPSLMNIGKGGGEACDQFPSSLCLPSGVTPPVCYWKGKIMHVLGTCPGCNVEHMSHHPSLE